MPFHGTVWRCVCAACLLVFMAAAPAIAQHQGFYYTVQSSDTLPRVAGRFGLSTHQIAQANRISPAASLVAGSRLWIPSRRSSQAQSPAPVTSKPRPTPPPVVTPSPPGVYMVKPGDSLWKIAKAHGLTVEQLARINRLDPSAPIDVGQRLVVDTGYGRVTDVPGGGVKRPDSPPPSVPTVRDEPEQQDSGTTIRPSKHGFIWPVEGRVIRRHTVRADEKHMGINIAVPVGTEVRAAKDGKVVYSGDSIPFYGNMVIIKHDNNLASCYAQNERLLVREGQQVKRGQVIARSGEDGRGPEPYLHFEIRRDGDAIDPEPYLP